ncbi:MAG: cytochrome c maturation protein CcmE [Chitinophagales bacterium]
MKRSHILILLFIAVGVGVVASQLGNVSSYANFDDAHKKEGKDVRLKGTLAPGKEIVYDPAVDANSFSFYLVDGDGTEKKVICLKEKPRDLEKVDEIVLTGTMKDDVFYAHDILVKCPSKYAQEEIKKEGI